MLRRYICCIVEAIMHDLYTKFASSMNNLSKCLPLLSPIYFNILASDFYDNEISKMWKIHRSRSKPIRSEIRIDLIASPTRVIPLSSPDTFPMTSD